MKLYIIISIGVLLVSLVKISKAQELSKPNAHAPIGVMGDHTHAKGEFMFSYRFMTMQMRDNRVDSEDISEDEIATTIPNRFSDQAGMPPTLRVVPTNMTMTMHMLGVMYAPTDNLTLMGMATVLSNSMDHITYQGGMGVNVLGGFTTKSAGFGDVKITAMYKFSDHWHINLGVSIPTGSIEEEDQVLTPMDMRPTLRLPYPMQTGSGTWDLLPGLTYAKSVEQVGYGAQASGVLRLGQNDNGFAYGNKMEITAWVSYLLTKWLSGSFRVAYSNLGKIDGIDLNIVAPVQTANPDFQGGSRVDGLLGLNAIGQSGFVRNQRLALEVGLPVFQRLNGPQLKASSLLTVGWQYSF